MDLKNLQFGDYVQVKSLYYYKSEFVGQYLGLSSFYIVLGPIMCSGVNTQVLGFSQYKCYFFERQMPYLKCISSYRKYQEFIYAITPEEIVGII